MKLPEIVAIGIYNSDIAAKNVSVSKNRHTSMFEIELPLIEGGVSYIDSVSTQIVPNMIICAKPGQVRHTKFPFKCYYVHMIVPEGSLHDVLMSAPSFFETAKTDKYKKIFSQLVKHYSTLAEGEEIILQSLLLELIYTISKDSIFKSKDGASSKNNSVIEESLNYVKEHLTEDLNLEIVAKSMSFSPIHFHNTFKAATGKTLRDYVEEQRIKKSVNLLLTTDYSLTKIAYECGFSSQSYFSYVFKRRMKKTPREYAKEFYSKYEI